MTFEPTRWSAVMAAGAADQPAARDALGTLCETYRHRLYAYVRRKGASPDDAPDLTQGCLTPLRERRDFATVRPERRFRAFLLGSLKYRTTW